jgi:hypothetical protein
MPRGALGHLPGTSNRAQLRSDSGSSAWHSRRVRELPLYLRRMPPSVVQRYRGSVETQKGAFGGTRRKYGGRKEDRSAGELSFSRFEATLEVLGYSRR